jgi:hypothetical protein
VSPDGDDMPGDKNKLIMMIGLPSTGKTTFLAALWYVVNNTDEVPGALMLRRLKGDQEHLNRIRDKWLQYLEVDRTNKSSEKTVAMELGENGGTSTSEVYFPDVSGEEFRLQVEERHCHKDYLTRLESSAGALFFVNVGAIKRPTRIDEVNQLAQVLSEKSSPVESDNKDVVLWSVELASLQAKLVELLQFMSRADLQKPFPVAIIFSAWDLVPKSVKLPESYLKRTLPLLDQYLHSNSHLFRTKCFGVSAQGIRLDNPKTRDKFAAETITPASRIKVKYDGNDSCDITIPIKWLMEAENVQ